MTTTERWVQVGPMDNEKDEGAEGRQEGRDLPKLIATVLYKAPVLVVRIGWPCLMMRRRARKCSKRMRREMVRHGMPPEMAADLAEDFVAEISIRKLVQGMDIPGMGSRWEDDSP